MKVHRDVSAGHLCSASSRSPSATRRSASLSGVGAPGVSGATLAQQWQAHSKHQNDCHVLIQTQPCEPDLSQGPRGPHLLTKSRFISIAGKPVL